jgi:hypothetical protein
MAVCEQKYSSKYNVTPNIRIGQYKQRASTTTRHIVRQMPSHLLIETAAYNSDAFLGKTTTIITPEFWFRRTPKETYAYSYHEMAQHNAHLRLCEDRTYKGFNANLATDELWRDYQLFPTPLLYTADIGPSQQIKHKGRDAIRFTSTDICTVFMTHSQPSEDIFAIGDYQNHILDLETGILLDRQIIVDDAVADREYVTDITVNVPLSRTFFESPN